jgi:hypothetical protein
VDANDLQTRLNALHSRSADDLDAVLAVHLDRATDERFNRFHEAMSALQARGALAEPSRRSLGVTHFVREGFTGAVYHQRNVARIELAVIAICQNAYPDGTHGLPRSNMGFGARTLSYEYHAFINALRATFEYLASAVRKYFQVRESKKRSIRTLHRDVLGVQPADAAQAVSRAAGMRSPTSATSWATSTAARHVMISLTASRSAPARSSYVGNLDDGHSLSLSVEARS